MTRKPAQPIQPVRNVEGSEYLKGDRRYTK